MSAEIVIVAATARTKAQFEKQSVLAASLRRLAFDRRIKSAVTFKNARPLPAVFNEHIAATRGSRILVFTHDDVWLDDYWLSTRLDEGLRRFDVLGVAGNRRRRRNQPGWAFTPEMQWDDPRHLSGGVCHPGRAEPAVSAFGPTPRRCQLLDGVFLAVSARRLLESKVRFDPRFAFHFYDLDFCRSAAARGLRLGTWPIAVTHSSGGAFGTPEWRQALAAYREKWMD